MLVACGLSVVLCLSPGRPLPARTTANVPRRHAAVVHGAASGAEAALTTKSLTNKKRAQPPVRPRVQLDADTLNELASSKRPLGRKQL